MSSKLLDMRRPLTPRNLACGILSMLTCFFSPCLCAFAHIVFSSWNTCSRPTYLQLGSYPASSLKPFWLSSDLGPYHLWSDLLLIGSFWKQAGRHA